MASDVPPQPNMPAICRICRWIYRWIYRLLRKLWNSRLTQFNIFDALSAAGVICAVITLYYTLLSVEAANKTFTAEQEKSTMDTLREYNYQFINGGFGYYEHLILDSKIIKTIENVMIDSDDAPVIMPLEEQRRIFLLICKMDSEDITADDVFKLYKDDSGSEQTQLTDLGKSILREKLIGYLNMRELMLSAINTGVVNKELYTAQLRTFNFAKFGIADLLDAMNWGKEMYPNISRWCGID